MAEELAVASTRHDSPSPGSPPERECANAKDDNVTSHDDQRLLCSTRLRYVRLYGISLAIFASA